MKDIATYGDKYGKWYEAKDSDGIYKTFRSYQGKYYYAIDPYEESEEEKATRIAREKALEREKKIDSILG